MQQWVLEPEIIPKDHIISSITGKRVAMSLINREMSASQQMTAAC